MQWVEITGQAAMTIKYLISSIEMLSVAKQKIDPNSIINPGVLYDPVGYSHEHWKGK
tara:strand:- start:18 stop:188 length:171 start_codon:yes stop_codon:yes gene_type:complete